MIRRAWVRPISGVVGPEVGSASRSLSERRGLLVALEDGEGRVGFGEATPYPGVSREELPEVEVALGRVAWSSLSIPARPGELANATTVPLELPASLRFALEWALVSLAAGARGQAPSTWLSGAEVLPIERAIYLGRSGDPGLVERAALACVRGCRALKIKAPKADGALIDAVAAVRAAVGASVELRLDFNGGATPRAVSAIDQELTRLGVAFVEEPCAPAELEHVAIATPWFADESLLVPGYGTFERAAGVVIKPSWFGVSAALALAQRAFAAHKDVVVTHAFEGPVALAACAELALAISRLGPARAPGLDHHAALAGFGLGGAAQVQPGDSLVRPVAAASGLDPSLVSRAHMELVWTR